MAQAAEKDNFLCAIKTLANLRTFGGLAMNNRLWLSGAFNLKP
jgi:hypothetical protein